MSVSFGPAFIGGSLDDALGEPSYEEEKNFAAMSRVAELRIQAERTAEAIEAKLQGLDAFDLDFANKERIIAVRKLIRRPSQYKTYAALPKKITKERLAGLSYLMKQAVENLTAEAGNNDRRQMPIVDRCSDHIKRLEALQVALDEIANALDLSAGVEEQIADLFEYYDSFAYQHIETLINLADVLPNRVATRVLEILYTQCFDIEVDDFEYWEWADCLVAAIASHMGATIGQLDEFQCFAQIIAEKGMGSYNYESQPVDLCGVRVLIKMDRLFPITDTARDKAVESLKKFEDFIDMDDIYIAQAKEALEYFQNGVVPEYLVDDFYCVPAA
jgi:hypothetical protein